MKKFYRTGQARKIAKGLFLAALIMSLAPFAVYAGGGRQAGSGEAAPAGPQKLVLYTWTNTDVIQPLLDGFNKEYAGKWVADHVRLPNAETMTINTALASGEQVDVMTQVAAIDLRVRYDDGVYVPLKQYFDRDGITYTGVFGESTEKVYNFDGDYYGMPYGQQIAAIFFNKKMFDEAGVPYPDPNWTWDDFREISKRLTKGSGASKVYGSMINLLPSGSYCFWDIIASQRLGTFVYYTPDQLSTRFLDPEMKESLQFFYDLFMVDQSAMPYSEYTALRMNDSVNGMKGLYSGRYAMWLADDGVNLFLEDSYSGGNLPAGTDIGMVNVPRPVGYEGLVTVTHGSTSSIPRSAKNPDGAWLLAKYQCITHADLFSGPKAMRPGYDFPSEAAASAFFDLIYPVTRPGFDAVMAKRIALLPSTSVNKDNSIVQGQNKINQLMQGNISLVFNGEMSVDECLRDLKTKGDQYIQEDLR